MSLAIDTLDLSASAFGAMTLGNEKIRYLHSNYKFAVKQVFKWYEDRKDYLQAKGAPNRSEVYSGELEEYDHVKNDNGGWERICDERNRLGDDVPWYLDPNKVRIWAIASEAADIAIVGISELQAMGYDEWWVTELFEGGFDRAEFNDPWIQSFRDTVSQLKIECELMGIDLAEAIVMKSAINEQHYPSAFLPWVMVDKIGSGDDMQTFARRMRISVGDKQTSQMPDLSATWMGELSLSRAEESPFSTDGFAPKPITIVNGDIKLHPGDADHTYDGLYAVGLVRGIYENTERRFLHEPERADFAWYYAMPKWREVMSRIKISGITEIIVPSGSGYRYTGLMALSKYEGLGFEHMGKVEDELQYKQYLRWSEMKRRKPDILEYQKFVAEAKQVRLSVNHDELDIHREHEGLVVGMDEIVVWWDEEQKAYVPIEKPANELEAVDQILRLVSGEQFFVSNATVVSHLNIKKPGEGVAVQLIPMRVRCKDDEERVELASIWLGRYQNAVKKIGKAKVTPGAVSLMSDFLQPYIMVRIPDDLDGMVIPFGELENYKRFMRYLVDTTEELPVLDLPDKTLNEIGISVGGFSIVGARKALERYLLTSSWFVHSSLDHVRERRIRELQEMLQIVV